MDDHYLWEKGQPWEGASHIPLIISWPQELAEPLSITAEYGSNSSAITELRDMFPTFYDIAGGNLSDYPFDGSSLLCKLQDSDCSWRTYIDLQMEQDLPPANLISWNAIVDDDGWKYFYTATDGADHLYNLISDPYETTEVSEDYPEVVERLRGYLVAQFESEDRGDQWVKDGDLVVRADPIYFSPNYPTDTSIPESSFLSQMFLTMGKMIISDYIQ